MTSDILDVAIIGAGISGINTAYRLQEAQPDATYTLFEGRDDIGGTWSFFKYPGLRSDSDLFSFGFEWNPWESDRVIADADSIMTYMRSSIRISGIDKHLELDHKLISLDWSSQNQCWTLQFRTSQGEKSVRARWIVLGTGYYDYKAPLSVKIPGLDNFKGQVIHPQFWPEDLDVTGKKVAIIGSGATAITILPNISEKAEHVTIVQRSPSYVATLPAIDPTAIFLKRWLPLAWATRLLRVKYLVLSFIFFNYCQTFPTSARRAIAKGTKKQLPSNISVDPHFTPKYGPWDQRLCMCPDGDFYAALRSGKASIVTGHIEEVDSNSITIKDQPESRLDVDIIVTATGLRLLVGGGAKISVDGKPVAVNEKMLWKGCMMQDVPNAVTVIGYTNASWTLGADVAAKTFTRLLQRLKQEGSTSVTPVVKDANVEKMSFMKMESTYLLKGRGSMPSAGNKYPWLPRGNYFSDMWDAKHGSISTDIYRVYQQLVQNSYNDEGSVWRP